MEKPLQPKWEKDADSDISLLCKLLREICSLTAPATGWDNVPKSTDHSLAADMVRIKFTVTTFMDTTTTWR